MSSVPTHLFLALEGVLPSEVTFFKEIALLGISFSLEIQENEVTQPSGGSSFSSIQQQEKKIIFKINYYNKSVKKEFIFYKENILVSFIVSFISSLLSYKKPKINFSVLFRNKKKDISLPIKIRKKEI